MGAASKKKNRRRRGDLVRPILVGAALLALPGYWIVHSIRVSGARTSAGGSPAISMQPIDPRQEAARVKAREEEIAKDHAPAPVYKPDLELVSSEGAVDASGQMTITGVVRNNAEQAYPEAEISFEVLNAQGQNAGVARARIRRIPAHGTAKFQAHSLAPLPHSFRLLRLEGR